MNYHSRGIIILMSLISSYSAGAFNKPCSYTFNTVFSDITLDLSEFSANLLNGSEFLATRTIGNIFERYQYFWNPCGTFRCGWFLSKDIAICKELLKFGYAPFYFVSGLHSTVQFLYDNKNSEYMFTYTALPTDPYDAHKQYDTNGTNYAEIRLTCTGLNAHPQPPPRNSTQFIIEDNFTAPEPFYNHLGLKVPNSTIYRMRILSPFVCPSVTSRPWFYWLKVGAIVIPAIATIFTVLILCQKQIMHLLTSCWHRVFRQDGYVSI